MKTDEIAEKYFKRHPNLNKNDLRRDIDQAIAAAVEEALFDKKEAEMNDPKNYRVAIRETDGKHFTIYKALIEILPNNWSVIMPQAGTLSKHYYTSEGALLPEFYKKFEVLRSEAALNLKR